MKRRLDALITDRGLVPSREQAQRAIRAGWVTVNQMMIDKPGTEIAIDAEIHIKEQYGFVSRGGEKLAGAIACFDISLAGRVCLDGGISTGGFTGYLLTQGADRIYGIDVGYGQVAWELRNDPRVILKERTNLRYLEPQQLYGENDPYPDLGVVDLSFISLTKVLPALWQLLISPKELLLLVKPQFEAGKEKVGKQGIVRDPEVHDAAIAGVLEAALTLGWEQQGMVPSPITGRKGNQEFWLWLKIK